MELNLFKISNRGAATGSTDFIKGPRKDQSTVPEGVAGPVFMEDGDNRPNNRSIGSRFLFLGGMVIPIAV